MVEVKHITKSFEGRVVLNDISAVFETGKTNLIIGRSGSGKTVLIKNIIGLMRPDSGEILYDGRDLTSMGKHELNMLRREMGMWMNMAGEHCMMLRNTWISLLLSQDRWVIIT